LRILWLIIRLILCIDCICITERNLPASLELCIQRKMLHCIPKKRGVGAGPGSGEVKTLQRGYTLSVVAWMIATHKAADP
jgi:hypothetical protein